MPQERDLEPGSRFWLLAAWACPIVPLAIVAAFCVWRVGLEFEFWRRGGWPFMPSVLACIVGFLAGAASLCGVQKSRAPWMVPPALLGLLLNPVVGCIVDVIRNSKKPQ
jgi:hypothetical protein